MAVIRDDLCEMIWNPGEWPFATRCHFAPGHPGKHIDKRGRVYVPPPNAVREAANTVATVLTSPDYRSPSLHRDKLRSLAMEWPSLAAVLAGLLESLQQDIPAPLRRARDVLLKEGQS